MSDSITLGVAQRWCHEYERALRASFAGEDNLEGRLPAAWEGRLAGEELQPTTLRSALLRYGQLRQYYGQRTVEKADSRPDPEEAQEAVRAILARDPVVTVLAGRRVKVTSRSYAAMAEIAAHDLRLRLLGDDLDKVAKLYVQERKRSRRRARLKRLQDIHRRIYGELLAHRRALYAHALTPHGGRATDPALEAPEWWTELGPEDDARLFVALVEAGPARYARLGKPPPVKDGGKKGEDFGFMSLLSLWEKTLKLRPAELYDEDLARVLVSIRATSHAMDLEDG